MSNLREKKCICLPTGQIKRITDNDKNTTDSLTKEATNCLNYSLIVLAAHHNTFDSATVY